jgi:hypothetical protein
MEKVALIDSDILCYRIGFACDNEDVSVAIKTMDKFVTDLITSLNITTWELFLTGKGNFRDEYAVTVPYKGNRTDKPKPVHIKALRQFLQDEWNASMSEGQEADDSIAIRATELGDAAIIVSLDKDFDQVQGWHYNFVKEDMYYVTAEEGLLSLYKQFLTGDRIDNIVGVKGIGNVKAHKLLSELKTEEEMFAVCVEHLGYERAVENGRLLYLRRKENELWMPPSTVTSSSTPSSLSTKTESIQPPTSTEASS